MKYCKIVFFTECCAKFNGGSKNVIMSYFQCMFGISRAGSEPFQRSSHLRLLTQTSPSSLKSLARKAVRRQHMRKRSTCDKKLSSRLETANMEDLVRYLDFRE